MTSLKRSLANAPDSASKDPRSAMQRAIDDNGDAWCQRLGLEQFASRICLSATHEQACDSMCHLFSHEAKTKEGGLAETLSNYSLNGMALWSLWEHATTSVAWRGPIADRIFMEALTCNDFSPPADRVLAELPRVRDTQKKSVLAHMVEGGHTTLVGAALRWRCYSDTFDDMALVSGVHGSFDSDTWVEMITLFIKFWQRYQCHQPEESVRKSISRVIAKLPYPAAHSAWLASGVANNDAEWPGGPRFKLTAADYMNVDRWKALVEQGYWKDAIDVAKLMCNRDNVVELASVTVAEMPWTAGAFMMALYGAEKPIAFLASLVSRWPLHAVYDCHASRQIMRSTNFVKGALLSEVIKRPSLLSLFCIKTMDEDQLCAIAAGGVDLMLEYSAAGSMQPVLFALSCSRKALALTDPERWIPVWQDAVHTQTFVRGKEVVRFNMLAFAVFRRAGYEFAPGAMAALARDDVLSAEQLDADDRFEWFVERASFEQNPTLFLRYSGEARVIQYLKENDKLNCVMQSIAKVEGAKMAMLALLAAGGSVMPIIFDGTDDLCRAALDAGYRPTWPLVTMARVTPERFLTLVHHMDAPPAAAVLYNMARSVRSISIFGALAGKFGDSVIGDDVLAVATVARNTDLCDLIIKRRSRAPAPELYEPLPAEWITPLVDIEIAW